MLIDHYLNKFLYPNPAGQSTITLNQGNVIGLWCSKPKGKDAKGKYYAATCESEDNFELWEHHEKETAIPTARIGNFKFKDIQKDYGCSVWVEWSEIDTGKSCMLDIFSKIIEVGFDVGGIRIPLYTSCYDKVNKKVHYVKHAVMPFKHQTDKKDSTPAFKNSILSEIDIEDLHSREKQQTTIAKLLGKEVEDVANEKLIELQDKGGMNYLARGEL
jgi:hypothetical protein